MIALPGFQLVSPPPGPASTIAERSAAAEGGLTVSQSALRAGLTRAAAVVNYEQAVEPFRTTSRLSETERAMLMGGACAKVYR
jgi:hypothetical protein